MCYRVRPALLALSIIVCAAPTFGQTKKTSLEDMLARISRVNIVSEAAISPDGKRVAWAAPVNGSSTAIYVAALSGLVPVPRRLTASVGAFDEHGIAWSPDSKKIAYLSDQARHGQLELYVVSVSGGASRRLTNLTGFLSDPRWSPDGREVAILFTENAPRAAGPLQPATIEHGVIEDHIYEQRLTTVEAATGKVKQLSPADLYVYEYDWSPDSKRFAAIAAHGDGDNNWFIAQLYTISATDGETKSIVKPDLQIAVPRWSPDGNNIAFIQGLMSDAFVNGGDIFTVSAGGDKPRNITPGMKASATWLDWSSNQILFTAHEDGQSAIATVDPAKSDVNIKWTGGETIAGEGGAFNISLSHDRKQSSIVRHSFNQAPEVWAGSIGDWKQITHLNKSAQPAWGEAKSVRWTNNGFNVQGWLMYPRNYDASRRYPMIVVVHGGPSSAVRPAWPGTFFNSTCFSNEGYFVFMPNPRGSYGQGEAFTRANVKDFGYGDLKDILAGVDLVVKTLPVDNDRIGITGWSYGGFMTMWTVTQTNRFKAAVAGAGIANWQSYYGENGIDQWMIPFFGASVYDDPAVYAKSAPITYIKKVKTPTLVVVGDRDIECPTPQSYEFWHALKTLGVKTQLVVYENEGHRIGKPEHRLDLIKRSVAWFNEHLGRE